MSELLEILQDSLLGLERLLEVCFYLHKDNELVLIDHDQIEYWGYCRIVNQIDFGFQDCKFELEPKLKTFHIAWVEHTTNLENLWHKFEDTFLPINEYERTEDNFDYDHELLRAILDLCKEMRKTLISFSLSINLKLDSAFQDTDKEIQ